MRWAYYSIQKNGPSFDFLTFMQMALYRGANGVWIENGKCGWHGYGGPEGEQRRLETIIKPIVSMYGLEIHVTDKAPAECVWPTEPDKIAGAHKVASVKQQPRIYPLMPSKQALDMAWEKMGGRRMVLVERKCDYEGDRNTTPGQLKWAEDRDAFVVPEGTPLEERVAYYEHALVVIGNNSGAMSPALFSHRPFMLLRMIVETCKATKLGWYRDNGLKVGFQFPWCATHQRIMWEHNGDSYEDIDKAYMEYASLNEQRL